MCGWNEPEKVNVQSVEVKVDAALIEQLRAGYAEMSRRQEQQLADSVAANSETNGPLSGPGADPASSIRPT
jgi:post-segregation antitoxin (ccd killing protein)